MSENYRYLVCFFLFCWVLCTEFVVHLGRSQRPSKSLSHLSHLASCINVSFTHRVDCFPHSLSHSVALQRQQFKRAHARAMLVHTAATHTVT